MIGGNGNFFPNSEGTGNSSALSFFGPNGNINRPVMDPPEGGQILPDENGLITKGFIPSGPIELSTMDKQKVSDRPRE